MSEQKDDERRGPISLAALVAFIAGLGVFFAANAQESSTPAAPAPDTVAEAPDPAAAPGPTVEEVSAGVERCTALDAGSQQQRDCATALVGDARSALVEGIAGGADPADLGGLWQDHATAVALALGPNDDPSAVFPPGALPAPGAGPSANTVACTPGPGTRRNLGVPGTLNRPSALGVAACEDAGAVALVALFRKSGGYYADGVGTRVCTGARCAVQAPSNNRCGRYRSYVVVYNRNPAGEAGPISDGWSKENLYCNPRAT